MTAEELERLRACADVAFHAPVFIPALVTGTGIWLVSLFAAAGLIRKSAPEARVWYILILLLICVSGAYLYYRKQSRDAHEGALGEMRAHYAADLQAQQLEEWRVHIIDALQVEEFDDEGSQFYLELEDGRVLFVMGQYLWDFEDDDENPLFPNRELLITRLPYAGDIFDMTCLGEHFPPSATRPRFTQEEYTEKRVPEDGQILPGPLSRYGAR
jgi:hypothetical protein